ncbi:MAG TPA: DUF6364 family protein [Thermoanaerobaculia bacterium]|nr:DUF6364 family protein [Thermoanaerobaculia bacterium]
MKNITLSVDERVLVTVRRYANERNSSVNRLVREFLDGIARHEDRARGARRRIRKLSDASSASIGAKLPRRDELHDR